MVPASKDQNPDGPIPHIDRIIHEPARYLIMANLFVVDGADFLYIMRQIGLTKGNLSSHMSKLEKAGYVKVKKEFVGKKPHTMLFLTKTGKEAFETYRKNIFNILEGLA